MKIFRITRKNYDGEVMFGIPEEICNDGDRKINSYLSEICPYTQCVPYYNNAKFGFISMNALCTFLFGRKKNLLSDEELDEINENYIVKTYEIDTWTRGLSKFMCTYFDDEIVEGPLDSYAIKELNSQTFKYIFQTDVPKEDIEMSKEQFYSNVKFHYMTK